MTDNDNQITMPTDTNNVEVVQTVTGVVRSSNNNIFQARVYMEDKSNVCGAEIIIFGDNTSEPIEKILITDVTDFDYLNGLVEHLEDALVPYTNEDKENIHTIAEYLSDKDNPQKQSKYLNMKWSTLHDKGNIHDILLNNMDYTDTLKSYEDSGGVVINASHFDGKPSHEYSLDGHKHNDYLPNTHVGTIGNATTRGHVKVINNLKSNEGSGSALSAKQGKVLNESISKLNKTVRNSWNTVKRGNFITLRYNPLLHLCVCSYNRNKYTGFKADTGTQPLHRKGALYEYAPTTNVHTPLHRGDIVMSFFTDGSVKVHNLTKHDSVDIKCQVMWYY